MTTTNTTSATFVSLSGHRPNEVLDVIRNRIRSGTHNDKHRVAVVVEGGAMRGIYTAGSLLALHLMGAERAFDNAYGTSAGAVNVGHFLSGLGHLKADTYYRCLVDGRFYNPLRLSKIVDIDFFADEVLTTLRPVDVDRIMHSPTSLWVSFGDFVAGQLRLYHAQSGEFPLLKVFKAATALPIFYNRLITLGNARGFDVGSVNPFPLDEALAHQNTHVLVLTAKPEGFRSSPRALVEKWLFNHFFARGNLLISKMYEGAGSNCDRLRKIAEGCLATGTGAAIATVAPISTVVGRTTQNAETLRSEMLDAARGTLRLFGHPEDQLDALIRAGTV
jgi:predicted patatin/cPLA2 family phospholipase